MNLSRIPSISIVMALKNKESTVRRAVDSILNQTIKNFELIIVDGSTDGGPELIRLYNDDRIIMVSEGAGGVGAARNRGIRMAKADLVAFLDADDEYHPNYLENAIKMENKYPEAFAYYQRFEIVDKDGLKKVPKKRHNITEPSEGLVERYFYVISEGGVPMTTSSVVIRRTLLLSLGGFKENLWYGEDTDLWGRIALFYKIAFNPNIGTIYHRDAPNRLSDRQDNPGEHVFIAELEKALMNNNYGLHKRNDIEEYIVKLRFSLVYRSLLAGDVGAAKNILKKVKTKRYRNEKIKWICWTVVPHNLFLKIHS